MGIATIIGNLLTDSGAGIGAANGVATLDSGGKIPASQLPNSVMEFKGLWDASTNTPTLANGTGNAGDVYEVSAAGTVNFGAGAISFSVGDYVLYDGSEWQFSSGQKGNLIGSGTANYLPKFTGANTMGNSQIFDNGTFVGVGTNSVEAGYLLGVNGDIKAGNIKLTSLSTTGIVYSSGGVLATQAFGDDRVAYWTGSTLAGDAAFKWVANSRLLINAPTDDTTTAVQINGNIKAIATTLTGGLTGTSATFNNLTQDAIQTILRLGGYNASGQLKALDFRLTAGTPVFTISTGAVGTDAGINIMPNGSSGLSLSYAGAATFSSTLTSGSSTTGNINAKSFLVGTDGTETNYRYQWYLSSNNLLLYSRGYGDLLTINYTTGAATFSSSVTATSATFTTSLTPLVLKGTNASTMWTEYYYNTSTLTGYIGNGSGILSGASASDFIFRSEGDYVVATGGNNRRLTIASTGAATFSSSVTVGTDIQYSSNAGYGILSQNSTRVLAFTNSSVVANVNVGIGVTPNASTIPYIDGGSNLMLSGRGNAYFNNNVFFDGGFKYIVNGAAGQYNISLGEHRWNTAPSGTAGNAISFTQAMTLNASGNLSIGNTNDTNKLDVTGPNGSVGTIKWQNAGGRKTGYLYSDSAGIAIYDTNLNDAGIYIAGNTQIDFRVNGSERMRITSGGVLRLNRQATYSSMTYEESIQYYTSPAGIWFGNSFNSNNNVSLQLRTSNDGTSVQAMTITSGGNVGIGTTAPSKLFTVQSADNTTSTFAAFYPQNGTQGVEIWYGGIQMGGSSASVDLNLASKGASGNMLFSTNATERMRITSGGNVGIGTTSPGYKLVVNGESVVQTASGVAASMGVYQLGWNKWNFLNPASSIDLQIDENGTPRMTFKSGGNVGIGGTGLSNTRVQILAATNNNGLRIEADGGQDAISIGGTGNISVDYPGVGAGRFQLDGNGNVYNRTGTYGTISDVKFKENIIDATPKLNDLMRLKVRNYNLIGDESKHLGFIAQEFEEVFPAMVDISGKGDDTYKTIKTSILVPMLVKALQELKGELDELKLKINA